MENRAYSIATGAFVLVLAVSLFVAAFWLGGGTIRGVPYDLISEASVAGLSTGAPVELRGVEVGEVQSIGFDPSDSHRVRVRVLVDPNVHLMEGTHATISYVGLSGTGYVELDYPDGASHTLETSDATPAEIPMRASGLAQLTEEGGELIKKVTGTVERVNDLLTPETSRNIAQLAARLNDAAASVTVLTRDLQPAAKHLDRVIADADTLLQSIHTGVGHVDALVLSAGAPGGAIDAIREGALSTSRAARDVDKALIYDTLPRIDLLAERLSRTSDSLNQLLQQVQAEPQSLIFGLPRSAPGPGEPGFQQTARK
jgi:phospholipid/cholesterol/gamma-HCH transport system substrate-binding protein